MLSQTSWVCLVCGTVYEDSFPGGARQRARVCARNHDLISEQNLSTFHVPHPGKVSGDGITRSDLEGHYRRGAWGKSFDQQRADVHKAMYHAQGKERRAMKAWLGKWFPDDLMVARKGSPLQKLAYAYHQGRWEDVKQAAYNLAWDRAIRDKIRELNIPEIISDQLELNRVLNEWFHDILHIDHELSQADIEALVMKWETDKFLEGLENGYYNNEDGNRLD